MTAKIFVDTNILIYAHDLDADQRHETARGLVESLWHSGNGVLSIQVLQEFYVNITRKIPSPLPRHLATSLIENYAAWQVVVPNTADVLRASSIETHYTLSFWDAMIISTASKGGAQILWTEDLSHGQTIEGIEILNPLI